MRGLLRGREVILCAGALHTPSIMLRSGLGPAAEVRGIGLMSVADIPGVGRNLQNHPGFNVALHLPSRPANLERSRLGGQAALRFSSGLPGCPQGDMFLCPTNRTAWHPPRLENRCFGTDAAQALFPRQRPPARGEPECGPDVRFNILDDERDYVRMREGVRFAFSILADKKVRAQRNEVFTPAGGMANTLNRPGVVNHAKALLISALFDLPGDGPAARARGGSSFRGIVKRTQRCGPPRFNRR